MTKIDYANGTHKDFSVEGVIAKADVVDVGGGKTSMEITLGPGFDWRKQVGPKLPGCPEWCPINHFGFLRSGKMKVKYQDGSDVLLSAGEAYNIPPGHLPEVVGDEPAVMVEFSQSTAEHIASMKE